MKKICLIFLLIILFVPNVVNAETVKTGKFKYMPAFEEETEEIYYYSDNYVKESGKVNNEHLLTMSYNLALSTFEIRGSTYTSQLYKDIGFKNIQADDMNEETSLNTIGTVIAHKKIDNSNVIAVAIRGEKYDCEWGNNFIVGKSGNAKGFDDASKKVISRIKKYISDNNLDNVKLWITGYSRAGAVADLIGVFINENLEQFNITENDLYVYTFETPAASVSSTIYDNIYVVKNKNDIIPMLYPKEWGFFTNGKVIEIGDSKIINTYIGLQEYNEYSTIQTSEFYMQFFGWLTSRLSRKTYAENLEKPVSQLLEIYFSKSTSDREKLMNFFMEDIKKEILDNEENKNKLVVEIGWSILGHNSDYLYQKLTDFLIENADNVRNLENGSVLTDEEYQIIKESLYPILRTIGPIAVDDIHFFEEINYDEYYGSDMALDYNISDEEMGSKYGKESGEASGYDDGLEGNEKNEFPPEEKSDYGEIYDEAYKNAYTQAYLEYYELGKNHRNDIVARGKYDGAKYAYYNGYYAGSHGEECISYDEYFYEEDWMTQEYINAYNEEYERLYLNGYEDGVKNPASEEEEEEHKDLSLYHCATLFKNIKLILEQHYPQNNLVLLKNKDSYYNTYSFIEGENQIINLENNEDGNFIFKANGDLEKLVKIQVDKKDVDESYIELKSGSTIAVLKKEFVNTLSNGTHKIGFVYIDNTIETTFSVVGNEKIIENVENISQTKEKNKIENTNKSVIDIKSNNPKTGDNIVFYVICLLLSVLGIIAIVIIKRFRKKQKNI